MKDVVKSNYKFRIPDHWDEKDAGKYFRNNTPDCWYGSETNPKHRIFVDNIETVMSVFSDREKIYDSCEKRCHIFFLPIEKYYKVVFDLDQTPKPVPRWSKTKVKPR